VGLLTGILQKKKTLWVHLLTGALPFAQFLTSYAFGTISDRVGRRPVLLVGTFGTAVTMILFGISTSVYMALGARIACGFMNGNSGVLKTYYAEILDKSNQACSTLKNVVF